MNAIEVDKTTPQFRVLHFFSNTCFYCYTLLNTNLLKIDYTVAVIDKSQQTVKKTIKAKIAKDSTDSIVSECVMILAIERYASPFLTAIKLGRIEIGSPVGKRELASFSYQLALMALISINMACFIKASTTTDCVLWSRVALFLVL